MVKCVSVCNEKVTKFFVGQIILGVKRANSWIMECEEFILPDWSPPDDPARPCRPKACYGLVMIMMKTVMVYGWFASPKTRMGKQTRGERPMPQLSRLLLGNHSQYWNWADRSDFNESVNQSRQELRRCGSNFRRRFLSAQLGAAAKGSWKGESVEILTTKSQPGRPPSFQAWLYCVEKQQL